MNAYKRQLIRKINQVRKSFLIGVYRHPLAVKTPKSIMIGNLKDDSKTKIRKCQW